METIELEEKITFEIVWKTIQENNKQIQYVSQLQQETDRQMKETDRK